MFRDIVTVLVLLIAGWVVHGKPAPQKKIPPPPPVPAERSSGVPDLAAMLGESNWGTVTQQGRNFQISGHPTWEAIGEVKTRADGSQWLWILWTLKSDLSACPGSYQIEGKDLHGVWGHSNDVQIDANGGMSGSIHHDRVYKLPAAEPPIH